MEVETDTESEKVEAEVSMSFETTELSSIPGAAERLDRSSQGEQVLEFTLTCRVLPHLDHSDSWLESSNHLVCELPKS